MKLIREWYRIRQRIWIPKFKHLHINMITCKSCDAIYLENQWRSLTRDWAQIRHFIWTKYLSYTLLLELHSLLLKFLNWVSMGLLVMIGLNLIKVISSSFSFPFSFVSFHRLRAEEQKTTGLGSLPIANRMLSQVPVKDKTVSLAYLFS